MVAARANQQSKYKTALEGFKTIGERLVWLMVLRVVLISVLLGATLIFTYREGEGVLGPSPKFLLYLIGSTYFFTVVYSIWFRTGKAIRTLARVQLTVDLFFWACITYATGGIVSGFTFLFDLWVIVAAVLLGGRAAFIFAGVSVGIITAMVAAMCQGLLSPLSDQASAIVSLRECFYFLSVNVAALFVVAGLVNSLVSRLEKTGHGLEIERTRRADLAQLHEDMIRSLGVGIATTNNYGEILMMNPAGRQILDISNIDTTGQHLDTWLPDPVSQATLSDLKVVRGESNALRADKTSLPIDYIIAPLLAAEGTRIGSIVAFSDQSEVRRLEAEVERSRRLAALGELAASLAHEIRNPLGAVSGSFQLLAGASYLGPEDTKLMGIISRELQRIERLVGDMLYYARPRQANLTSTDMCKLVDETVKAFLMGKDPVGVDVVLDIDSANTLLARADQSQIRQVLWNLLRNAAQVTPAGGRIEVAVFRESESIVLEVRDTGPGINEEEFQKIFDPFYSKRERGIGLGLAICRRIAEEHKGHITASNRSEKGSVFRMTIPAYLNS